MKTKTVAQYYIFKNEDANKPFDRWWCVYDMEGDKEPVAYFNPRYSIGQINVFLKELLENTND
jgi:hypothetical protein